MRYIKYLFLAAIAISLIAVAVANRGLVQLKLLPNAISDLVGIQQTVSLPLFIVIFGAIVVGLLIGFVWEWLREHKHRAEVTRKEQEVKTLKRELRRAGAGETKEQDEVLALLD